MSAKHRLKLLLRDTYAAVLTHTGLYRVVSAFMAPRLVILAGHCVRDACNDELPEDMKISAAKLEALLRALGRFAKPCTVGEGVAALDGRDESGGGRQRALFALSMDDGYKDNATVLPDLLERVGARATVFLESRPLTERRVNWSHKWFWLIQRHDVEEMTRRYMALSTDVDTLEKLRRVLEEGVELAYRVKRVFKYDAPPEERDRVLDAIFTDKGGDERALCERIYMTVEEARAVEARGLELGGHTVHHHVLSTLEADDARAEVLDGRRQLEELVGERAGTSFAYPFGRRWDYDEASRAAVREAGYVSAVTTHSGCNTRDSDRTQLARWMIDEDTRVSHLVTEACGGFALLRRLGIDFGQ